MDQVKQSDISKQILPGEQIYEVFGPDAYIPDHDAYMAYCKTTCVTDGLSNHCHTGNSVLYILQAKDTVVRYGKSQDAIDQKQAVQAGTVLHIEKGEWYRFEFSSRNGSAEYIIFSALSTET